MKEISRRSFISDGARALGSGWLTLQWPVFLAAATAACDQREAKAGYANLDAATARTLAAVAEQIFPADETPGADEIGVVWFIDALMAGRWGGMRPMLEAGARALDDRSGTADFIELPFGEQTEILRDIENEGFFQTMRLLTLGGVFAMPSRGGNREKAAWALIGFEDRHGWQPPFGHYDTPGNLDAGSGEGA